MDNTDSRINIDPREKIHFDLQMAAKSGVAQIVAPNGGNFNVGEKKLTVDPAKGSIAFDFSAGPNPGRYTVEITQGNVTRTFEFWAGAEPPQGKPGPALSFK